MSTVYEIDLPAFKAVLDQLVEDYARKNAYRPGNVISYAEAMSGLSAVMTLMRRNRGFLWDTEFEAAYDQAFAAMQTIFNPNYQPAHAEEAACSSHA
ncbi:hypothetical protein [Methylomonas rapida]|uniref:Uncharacterized protein n=1 Tax=Methylomonas rapida TaxID=2963939 RepID=A0ABY7GQX7_9GAMM|nr:hypothetical protein [Methylomonas rapida]WAR46926.1 hypothetical protein NM686_010555 [Methylomonas rapida]